jgi:predicted tellurium resistance membrane protein TerC
MAIELLEALEPFAKAINVILSLLILIIGTRVTAILSGKLKRIWIYFMVSLTLFGFKEILEAIEQFGVGEMPGLYEILEVMFAATFLVALYRLYLLFREVSKRQNKRKRKDKLKLWTAATGS